MQPAGGSLCRVLAPSLLPGTLKGADILASQIRAKGSIWLGRKGKPVFCLWLEDAPLSQWTSAAGSLSLNFLTIKLLSVVIMEGLPSQVELLHTTSAPNRANAKEMSVRQGAQP